MVACPCEARDDFGARPFDVRCGDHFKGVMGEEFSLNSPPVVRVHLIGAGPFAKVHIIRDGVEVYTTSPQTKEVSFEWDAKSAGRTA
jgi:hypothetical protein